VEEEDLGLLVRMDEERAAPRIADRVRQMLAAPVNDPEQREQLVLRANAVADLGYFAILPDVRKAIESQPDPTVVGFLRELAQKLAALEERKDDPKLWTDALSSSDPELRRLAYRRLADLKPPLAVRPLMEAFGRVDVAEGADVLRTLGTIASPETTPLLERVLLDPSFDEYERAPLRSMAAWAASKMGPQMAETLRRSALRRDGRDVDVLVYLAVLTGKDSIATLESLRVPRLRWFDWKRGGELDRLDGIVRDLKAGRSVEDRGAPPGEVAAEEHGHGD
jgi:hypothetical protein